MIKLDCKQLCEEWFEAHIGIPSASQFSRILSPTGKPSAQADKYINQLAAEIVTGRREETYTNADMQRGIDLEPEARAYYELLFDVEVEQVGCVYPDDKKTCLCSPDGLMPAILRGLEIKCPKPATHIEYLKQDRIPNDYIPQVQGSLYITGYPEWHFVSYCPGIKPLIILVKRDIEWIAKFEHEIGNFNEKLKQTTKEIT